MVGDKKVWRRSKRCDIRIYTWGTGCGRKGQRTSSHIERNMQLHCQAGTHGSLNIVVLEGGKSEVAQFTWAPLALIS
jgi:hypothetical protein